MKNIYTNVIVAVVSSAITFLLYHYLGDRGTISFKKEKIQLVPFEHFEENTARFNNVIASKVRDDLIGLGYDSIASLQCTFPLNSLKNFIYKIDSLGKANDKVPYDDLSVTMHYAVYPRKTNDMQPHPEYTSLQTLYLAPSIYTSDGVRPILITENSTVLYSGEPLTGQKIFLLNNNSLNIENELVKNQGQLCPPDCSDFSQMQINQMDYSHSYLD